MECDASQKVLLLKNVLKKSNINKRLFFLERVFALLRDPPRLDASVRSVNCQLGAITSFDRTINIRVR